MICGVVMKIVSGWIVVHLHVAPAIFAHLGVSRSSISAHSRVGFQRLPKSIYEAVNVYRYVLRVTLVHVSN